MFRESKTLIELRDQTVRLHYRMGSGEPEIANGEPYVDEYHLEDRTGEWLDWDLSDQEDEQVRDLIFATENYEAEKRGEFLDDEEEPRRSWRRRNPNAPTGTGRY